MQWSGGLPKVITKKLPELGADLVRIGVDLIVTSFTPAALAAKNATSSIPIVVAYTTDPVENGLVQSLSPPGGNITGLAANLPALSAKQIELLREIIKGLSKVGVLMNTSNSGNRNLYMSAYAEGERHGIEIFLIDIRA